MDPRIRTTRRYLGVPSNAKRPPHARRIDEWDRRDVSWDDSEPLGWQVLSALWTLLAGLVIFAGMVSFLVLLLTLVPGPGQ